ncbi:hypothetical protein [Paraliomyxa miuraensis]|uniref:hypothetical protein n=1 Tax=Paraliomyxa miuraensis TaxID=376150 RepID=UPI0022577804|nr:hypothetical protein [Paraliomyxa miuraensis]MCX4247733.1 hypothetical protein [Paraliomyxa miuraensis]
MRWLAWAGGLGLGLLAGWACGTGSETDCAVGSLECACTTGGACDPGLTCVNDKCILIDCPVGREGCPCTGGGACDPGLTCEGDTCVDGDGTGGGPGPSSMSMSMGDATADEDSGGLKLDVGSNDLPVGPCSQTGCTRVDMLFAIDSSLSMNEEIQALAASQAFTAIVQDLEDLNCGGIEYRIGITNDNNGGFIGSGGQPWFDSNDMTQEEIASAFSSAALSVPCANCTPIGCEHVLSTALSTLALDTSGFLRPDALLVLVLITDVDDYGYYDQMGFGGFCDGFLCTQTPQPVDTIYDQLVTLKGGDPAAVAAVVVAGDPTIMEGLNTCGQPATCCGVGLGECAQAHHAPRLYEFADMQAGTNGYAGNICDGAAQIPLMIQDALTNNVDLACQTYEPPG